MKPRSPATTACGRGALSSFEFISLSFQILTGLMAGQSERVAAVDQFTGIFAGATARIGAASRSLMAIST